MASVRKPKRAHKRGAGQGASGEVRSAADQILSNQEILKDFIDEVTDQLEDFTNCDDEDLARDPAKLNQSLQAMAKDDKCVEELFSDMDSDNGVTVDWTRYNTGQKRQILATVVKSPKFHQVLLTELND